jgi:hypothetical protein
LATIWVEVRDTYELTSTPVPVKKSVEVESKLVPVTVKFEMLVP